MRSTEFFGSKSEAKTVARLAIPSLDAKVISLKTKSVLNLVVLQKAEKLFERRGEC